MTNAAHVAQRYIAVWNETDPDRRLALLVEHWSDDAHYLDPMAQANGHAGVNALIGAMQQRFPNCRFILQGTPDGHNGRVRFSWSLAPAGAAPIAGGTDFIRLAADGRIRSVSGFLDRVPEGA
ncbi:nuclear transport factor 2 family protein [Azospirillum brasilense]|uniref:nuclear transport factor 2 family protein n=1 Tax=Azospirillum brasilense TaxID=192 RepID=UPI001909E3F9|nr:nuclear transport factor 2 family protein [Azospirillum brasilense]MBK3734539.1 nuclear transport factor 2 family protein [Azospirillum brasilense]